MFLPLSHRNEGVDLDSAILYDPIMEQIHRQIKDETIRLLWRAGRGGKLLNARVDLALEATGLSGVQLLTLRHLVEAGEPLALSQLADRMGFPRSNVTWIIDRLEEGSLVERVRDRKDRRSVLAQVTENGCECYKRGMRALTVVEDYVEGRFTPGERTILIELLSRLEEERFT